MVLPGRLPSSHDPPHHNFQDCFLQKTVAERALILLWTKVGKEYSARSVLDAGDLGPKEDDHEADHYALEYGTSKSGVVGHTLSELRVQHNHGACTSVRCNTCS